jgi:hypothetical protein
MVQISRFWDGTTLGDATVAPYDAGTEFSEVMTAVGGAAATPNKGGIIKNTQGDLSISSPSAGTVRIGPGEALVYGAWYKSDTNVDHTFAAPAAAARTDRIVLRKSWGTQTVRQVIIAGAEGGGVPVLQQVVGTTWDVPLAQIAVATNGTITITDQRSELGVPPTDVILTDPTIRDTIFFGAKPAGVGDARLTRIAANHLAMPSENFTVGILNIDGPIAQERLLKFQTNGLSRWFWGIGANDAEGGSNAGGNMILQRYNDAGAVIGLAMSVSRASGTVSFSGAPGITAPGTLTIQPGSSLVLSSQAGGSVQFSPSSTYIHPATDAATYNGHPSYRWAHIYAVGATFSTLSLASDLNHNNGTRSIWWNPAQSAWFAHLYSADGYFRLQFNGGNTAFAVDTNGALYTTTLSASTQVSTSSVVSGGNISLTAPGGYVHPASHAAYHIGHPSLSWVNLYAATIQSYTTLTLNSAAGGTAQINAGFINFISTGAIGLDTGPATLNFFAPNVDNKVILGSVAGGRWTQLVAANGSINTCRAEEKLIINEVDGQWALEAILNTPIKLFRPKNYCDEVDDTLLMAGIVDDCADPRMQIGEGSQTSAGHQAALSMAGIQRLHARLAELEREVECLKSNRPLQ